MNRIVANDLEARANNRYSINDFHSQGMVIGKGINSILESKGLKYDEGYQINAIGPAVTKNSWYKSVLGVSDEKDSELNAKGKQVPNYDSWYANEKDQVQHFANPVLRPDLAALGVLETLLVITTIRDNTHSTDYRIPKEKEAEDKKDYSSYLKRDPKYEEIYKRKPY